MYCKYIMGRPVSHKKVDRGTYYFLYRPGCDRIGKDEDKYRRRLQ